MGNSTRAVGNEKEWLVRDPVHGDIRLPPYVRDVVAQPLFQRLRYIKQTGLLYLVFPGAQHTRFEHSVGAAHLASSIFCDVVKPDAESRARHVSGGRVLDFAATAEALDHLRRGNWERHFVLAALLHDLGHGPLSHTFEKMRKLDQKGFVEAATPLGQYLVPGYFAKSMAPSGRLKHEDITLVLIEEILRPFPELWADWHRVAALAVSGYRDFILDQGSTALFSSEDLAAITLLAPYISGVFDVDRTDYLARDSLMAGVAYGRVEGLRVLKAVRPVIVQDGKRRRGGLVASARDVHMLDHFLVCLYEMYTQVYLHPVAVALEHELLLLTGSLESSRWDAAWYKEASDAMLFDDIAKASKNPTVVRDFLYRRLRPTSDQGKRVIQILGDGADDLQEVTAQDPKYIRISAERPLLKDSERTLVWLRGKAGPAATSKFNYLSWESKSFVASKLTGWKYSPEIWWRNSLVTEAVAKAGNERVAADGSQSDGVAPAEKVARHGVDK